MWPTSPGLHMHYGDAEQVVTKQMQGDVPALETQPLSSAAEWEI